MLSLSVSEIHGTSRRLITETWARALRAIFPVECAACGRRLTDDPVPFFCRTCWGQIRPLSGPACPRCDRPFPSPVASTYSPTHLCGDCRKRMPSFTKAWSFYPYDTPLREAIALLKYQGKYAMAPSLCRLLLAALPASLDVDVVMPVPLHPARLRGREYNQSLLLAQAVSRQLEKPLSYSNLVRIIDTAAQTTLSRSARLSNLRQAFRLRTPRTVQGQRVLVVDDVFTTGTTLHECAKALRKGGAGDVYVLTLARTVDRGLLPDHHVPVASRTNLQFAGL
jgi:ComF family protein